MTIKDLINADLKSAMRAQDKKTIQTLRLITAAVKQVEVDERIDVDESRMLLILDKLAKQRNESIAQFQKAMRDDLIVQEQSELEIIKRYLPAPLSEEKIKQLVVKAISDVGAQKMGDMGKVMAQLKPQLQGRSDMSQVSAMIKAALS